MSYRFFLFMALTVGYLCTVEAAVAEDQGQEFYIFDVGQGNAQLAVYKKSKFAVLYDCGSSSQQSHPKFQSLSGEEDLVFEWNKKDSQKPLDIGEWAFLDSGDTSSITSNKEDLERQGTKSIADDIKQTISGVISESNISNLFIFLSHPDKDHVNYTNNNVIPSSKNGLKIVAYLSGDWLTEQTTEAKNVLTYLLSLDNCMVHLPYYWDYQQTSAPKNYVELMGKVRMGEYQLPSFSLHSPTLLSMMTLSDLLNRTPQIPAEFKDILNIEDIQNVHIISMNHGSRDKNNQSCIINFHMNSMNLNLLCTGDASADTIVPFEERKLPETFSKAETFMMIPHHGSKDNWIPNALKVFKPSLFGISAGNGKQYGHPNKELIEAYNQYILDKQVKRLVSSAGSIENKFISFSGKEEAADSAHMIVSNSIVCTNVLSTLKFTHEGIYSKFSDIIHIKDHQYRCDLRKRVQVQIDKLSKIDEAREDLLWELNDQNIVYYIVDEDKNLIYQATHIKGCICGHK